MPRKRRKKNMYDEASMFDIHVFIQSGGLIDYTSSVPVVQEAPTETDLGIIAEEIVEWFNCGGFNKYMTCRDITPILVICSRYVSSFQSYPKCAETILKHHEKEIRKIHREYNVTDFLWKRGKKK